MSKEIDLYRLRLHVVGPDYRDTVDIDDVDPLGLEYEIVTIGDQKFQRYSSGDDGCFIEVRADWVVSRQMMVIYKETSPVARVVHSPVVGVVERPESSTDTTAAASGREEVGGERGQDG